MKVAQWIRGFFSNAYLLRSDLGWIDWLNPLSGAAARKPVRRSRRYISPCVECLDDRLVPTGNLTLTNAFLVDGHDNILTTPNKGEQVFLQANWTTQNLPSNASYHVSFSVAGVVVSTPTLTAGAGGAGTGSWYWWLSGWYATPGTHNVTVTVNPDQEVAETTYGDNSRSFSFTPISAPDLPEKFIFPVADNQIQTWRITNYVDVNSLSGSIADYSGGSLTYDGHTGHDIGIANFGVMDEGVPAFAAASGTVIDVQDGNFDRNTVWTNPPANYVTIDHGNGWHTIYYHFRANTILVRTGDTVVRGQTLGLIGSSGNSTGPNLHFQVEHNGAVVETEYDPTTYWLTPELYQGTVRSILDSGITGSRVAFEADNSAGERTVKANIFSQASGQVFSTWFGGHLVNQDAVIFKVYKPDGTRYSALDFTFNAGGTGGGSWYFYAPLPANLVLGTWHVGIEVNGVELAREAFQVTVTGAGAGRVTRGTTYVANGRTTPIDFGTASSGASPPQQTFTISNLGSASLSVNSLVLPTGFTLVNSFPSSIAIGGSATFTIQMATATSGSRSGVLSFATNDPNAPTYSFAVSGLVSGGDTGAIHGQIFNDLNGNSIEEGSDAGLTGWSVNLLDPTTNSIIATTTTGFNGYYSFLNLVAGNYRVREIPPTGWYQSTVNPADVVVVTTNILVPPFGLTADSTLPTTGTVNDGLTTDVDFQASTTTISANWTGFGDSASGIANYQWAIGTSPGTANVQAFTNVENATSASVSGLGLINGTKYYVAVRATDNAGNVSNLANSSGVTIDTTPPDTSISGQPSAASSSTSATFTFTGADPGGSGVARLEASLDGVAFATAISQVSLNGLTQGTHVFQVRAIDQVENIDATPASYNWTVDTTPPDTIIAVQPPSVSKSASATFSFSGTDNLTAAGSLSFEGSLDGSAFATVSNPMAFSGLSAGAHTLRVRAKDQAGNLDATTANFSWTVQIVPVGPESIVGRPKGSGDLWVAKTTGANFVTTKWGTWPATTMSDVLTGDFNGDGVSDLAGRNVATGIWYVGISNGTSAYAISQWDAWSSNPSITWVDVKASDVNGDGKTDILGRWHQTGKWYAAISTGTGFATQFWTTWSSGATWINIQLGDFDGDGRSDLAGRVAQGGDWWISLSKSTGIVTTKWGNWAASPTVTWVDPLMGDLDGDGKMDMIARHQQAGKWYASLSTGTAWITQVWTTWSPNITWVDVKLGDMDGDGRADLIGRVRENGQWYVSFSVPTGVNTSLQGTWNVNPNVTWADIRLGDFDGDGKIDIAGWHLQSGQWFVSLSRPTGLLTQLWGQWNSSISWLNINSGVF